MIQPSQIGEKLFAKTRCHHFKSLSLPAPTLTLGPNHALAPVDCVLAAGKCGA